MKFRDFGAQLAPGHAPPKYGSWKYQYGPDGPRGSNGASNYFSHYPDLPHIGFDGSRTNILGVVAQNATTEIGRECLN